MPESSTSRQGVQYDWDDNISIEDPDRPAANLNPSGMGQESPRRNRGTHWPDSSDDEGEAQDPWEQRQQRGSSVEDYESLSSSPEIRGPIRTATYPRAQRRPSPERENANRIDRNVPRRESTFSQADEEDDEDEEEAQIRLATELSLQVNEDEEFLRALELSRIEAEQRNRDINATEDALVADVVERSRFDQLLHQRPRPLEKTVRPAQRSNPTQSSAEKPRPAATQRNSTPNVRQQVERPPQPNRRSTPNVNPPAEKPRLGLETQRITPKSRPLVDSPAQATPTKPFSAESSEPTDFETRVAIAESLRTATRKSLIEAEAGGVGGSPGAWHYDGDDGRHNTNRRFDPPARRPPSPPDEESDDDIYGPPVIDSSVPPQNLDDDIYGIPSIESSIVEPEHATSLSGSQDGPSVEVLSHPTFSRPEVEPQIESNMVLVEESAHPPRVSTQVLPNDELSEEPSIANVEPSESHATISDHDPLAKSRSSSPLPVIEETQSPPSPLNVMETATELPTDEHSNSPNQNAPPYELFRDLYESALQKLRPLQTRIISSVSNSEQIRSVPMLGQPSGQQADQEIHTGNNVEPGQPIELSPSRPIRPPLSAASLDQSSPRDGNVPTSPASTSPPIVSVRVPPPLPVKPVKLKSVRQSVTPSSPASPSTPQETAGTSSQASFPRSTERILVPAPPTRTFLPALETSAEALDYFIPPENFDVIASTPQAVNVYESRISVSQETHSAPTTDSNPSSNGFPSTSFSPASILALTEPSASLEYLDNLDSSMPFLPANIFGPSNATPQHASSANDKSASTNHPTPLTNTFRPSETNATAESSPYTPFPSSMSSPANIRRRSETRIVNHVLSDDPFPSTPFSAISIFALSDHDIDHSDTGDDLFPTITFSLPNTSTPIVTSEYDASPTPRSPQGQPFSNTLESEVQSGSTSLFLPTMRPSTNLYDSYNLSSPTEASRNTIPYEPNFSAVFSESNLANDVRDDDARSVFIPPASWNQPAVFDDPRLDITVPSTFDVSAILSQSTLSRNDVSDEHSSSSYDPLLNLVPPANFSK